MVRRKAQLVTIGRRFSKIVPQLLDKGSVNLGNVVVAQFFVIDLFVEAFPEGGNVLVAFDLSLKAPSDPPNPLILGQFGAGSRIFAVGEDLVGVRSLHSGENSLQEFPQTRPVVWRPLSEGSTGDELVLHRRDFFALFDAVPNGQDSQNVRH